MALLACALRESAWVCYEDKQFSIEGLDTESDAPG